MSNRAERIGWRSDQRNDLSRTGFVSRQLIAPIVILMTSPSSMLDSTIVSSLKKRVIPVPEADVSLAAMTERASNVAKQMSYFGLVIRRAAFEELVPSARRAGFNLLGEDRENREAAFEWPDTKPDFTFLVSFGT